MKLADKIVALRKKNGLSQEELAEKLQVSRQAISRWEVGSALPDAHNILQLSKLFEVSTDYLLNEEYSSDNDIPKVKETKEENIHLLFILLVILEIMCVLMQFMCIVLLQNLFFGMLSCIPFIAMIGGFEYAYQRYGNENGAKGHSQQNHGADAEGRIPVPGRCGTDKMS